MMKINQRGIDFIKQREKFEPNAYWDDLGKVWTIGYGETKGVKEGDTISEPDAYKLLLSRLVKNDRDINKHINSNVPLTQDQYNAIASHYYNTGSTFSLHNKPTQFIKKLNAGKIDAAFKEEFPGWMHAKGKEVMGLKNRRAAELDMIYPGFNPYPHDKKFLQQSEFRHKYMPNMQQNTQPFNVALNDIGQNFDQNQGQNQLTDLANSIYNHPFYG